MRKVIAFLLIVIIMVIGYVTVRVIHESQNPTRYEQTPGKTISSTIVTSQKVEAEINKFRTERGLYPLIVSPVLDQAAQQRAETMCIENDFTHDKAWQVLDPLYQYKVASENLHYDYLQEDQAANAVYGWAHSPGHLKTMLADNVELGVGVKLCPGYQGMGNAVLITSYYGVPK